MHGLPWGLGGKESICQCSRHGFNPRSGKIPRAVEQLSSCSTTTEPALQSPRAELLHPCAAAAEACLPRAHALQQEEPPRWEAHALQRERSQTPQREQSQPSNVDPAQPESKLDHLKENRKFSPKLTHRQPNSVSSENHVAQKTFQKAEETALNISVHDSKRQEPEPWRLNVNAARGHTFQFPTVILL